MKTRSIQTTWICLVLFAWFHGPNSFAQQDEELPKLEAARTACEKDFIEKVSPLQDKYETALHSYERNFTKAGDLVSASEASEERKLAKNWNSVPFKVGQRTLNNDQLNSLLESYEKAVVQVVTPVTDRYLTGLEDLKNDFTRDGNLSAALKLEGEITAVQSGNSLLLEAARKATNEKLSKGEFAEWLKTHQIEFSGAFSGLTTLTFDDGNVRYKQVSKGTETPYEYKIDSARSILMPHAEWRVTFAKDLSSGTFSTQDNTYPITIKEKP